MKVEISPHAKRRIAERKITEKTILETLKNPDGVLFDEETGHFIAVRRVDDRLSVVAYLLLGDVVRVVSAFLTSKLNIVEKRVSKGRWRRL